MNPTITEIQLRRGTAADWATVNPVLTQGEPGWESDTNKVKFGDGISHWNSLPYFGGGSGVTTFNTRSGAVTLSKTDVTATGLAAADIGADTAGAAASEQTRATAAEALLAPLTERVNAVATSGATQTIPDVSADTMHRIVLSANCTLTFPTAAAGKSFLLALVQDATGSRTVTWPGTVKWPGGTAPTLTTTATKTDLFSFTCLDGTNWLGLVAGQNF